MKHPLVILFFLIPTLNFAGIGVKKIGELVSKLNESSGLEYYKGKIITHNDSGGEPRIFVINENGEINRTIHLENAKNQDWEDITSSPDGRLFVGDIGNNSNKRKQLQIYVLEDDFLDDKDNMVASKKITYSYEDQTAFPPDKHGMYYNAEAMFWMSDSIYIFTKCDTEPFTGKSYIYVLPDQPGNYKARKIGEFNFCSTAWSFCAVTSADYHHKSKTLAILLYGKLVLFTNFDGNKFWEGDIKTHNIPTIKQREAITFIDKDHWYMTDERHHRLGGGNIYKITKK